jgi:glycosyltransferase involved in cell wall biosynthesis
MDVFALSSDTEQMPVSVLEAMSVGLPVVGTAVGDVPNMVSAENMRHMHALTQDDAFAGSLSELMAHPDRRAAIGQANRERCEREYSLRVMTGTYMDLYRRAIDSYVAPRRAPAAG